MVQADYLTSSPYFLDCQECPREQKCFEWGVDGLDYKYEGKPIAGIATVDGVENWERCPVSYLRLPSVNYAVDLYNQGRVFGTLDGWPDSYASWVVRFVSEIHSTMERVSAERMSKEMRL